MGMKSSQQQLENRGYVKQGVEGAYSRLPFNQKILMLKSKIATDRTLGARLLKDEGGASTSALIAALKIERKLYPKMEICQALLCQGKRSVKSLIDELGLIGCNQYTGIPLKAFHKDSYPLPRDIAARTLAKVGAEALPELFAVLLEKNLPQISEALDAIGFICFYRYDKRVFEKLLRCYESYRCHELICWKIFRAMSACPESLPFLEKQKQDSVNRLIINEINRSIRLISKSKKLSLIN
jgi:hypothetical protein